MKLKYGILLPAVGCLSLFPACAHRQQTVQNKPVIAQTAKKAPETMLEGEKLYFQAMTERDKKQQEILFRQARNILEGESRRGELKADLLLGYMLEMGQGGKADDLAAVRHLRIAADGGRTDAKLALADFWMRHQILLPEAVKQIKSIPDYENNPAALYTLGNIYFAGNEEETGFQYLKKSYILAKNNPRIRIKILKLLTVTFEAHFKADNHDAALKDLERQLELEPKRALLYYLKGVVQQRKGQLKEAEKSFDESLHLDPALPYAYNELAFLKALDGRAEEALDDIKVAYAISGKSPKMLLKVTEICFLTKQYDALLSIANRYLKKKADQLWMYRIRAMAYLVKREYANAVRDYERLCKDPKFREDASVLDGLANAYTMTARFTDAENILEKLLKKQFDPGEALNLAELYVITGKYQKTLDLLARNAFKTSKDKMILCVAPYLEATAKLALGKDAQESIKKFETALPAYRAAAGKKENVWNVEMFEKHFLHTNKKLTPDARRQIQKMTDQVVGRPPKPAAKPSETVLKK